MIVHSHGGFCCGIRHVHGFPTYSNAAFLEFGRINGKLKNRLVEVVLTTRKTRWHEAIKSIGYKEVNRFRNPSTGNTCVVYHRQPCSNLVIIGEDQW